MSLSLSQKAPGTDPEDSPAESAVEEVLSTSPPSDNIQFLEKRERSATAVGMGLVAGPAPKPPGMETRGPFTSQSKLEVLAKSYSGGRDKGGGGGGREGIQNYLMKVDSYRFLSRTSKSVTTGPARKAGSGWGAGRGGGRGRGGTRTEVPHQPASDATTTKKPTTGSAAEASLPTPRRPSQLNMTTEDNPVPSGTQTSDSSENYIEACSNVYVVLAFIVTLLFPTCTLLTAAKSSKVWGYANYLAASASYEAMIVAIFLQPRNNSNKYKALLYTQAFLLLAFPDIINLIFVDSTLMGSAWSFSRVALGLWLLRFVLSVRSRASYLLEQRLSRFLTDNVLFPALSFMGILTFFALDPIKCWLERPDDLEVCKRTLIGQAGLSGILLVHLAFSSMSAVFPKRVRSNHTITLLQFATGNLTFTEGVKLTVLAFAASCAFLLFAQYNARAIINDGEFFFLVGISMLGGLLLLLSGIWEWKSMERETRELEEDGLRDGEAEEVKTEETRMYSAKKLHWGFQAAGAVACCTHTLWSVLRAVTLDEGFGLIQPIMLPFTILLFVVAFIADPKSGERRFEVVLFLSFSAAEILEVVWSIRTGSMGNLILVITRAISWCVLIHLGLKARKLIAAMEDDDLSNFLSVALLENVIQKMTGMLFVTFKALNCIMETGSFKVCETKILCSMHISVYLTGFVATNVIRGAMSEERKRSQAMSWGKLATMKDVRLRHKVSGFLSALTGASGMFLFCLMNSEASRASVLTIQIVGYVGIVALVAVFALELVVLLRTSEERRSSETNLVTEIADFWVGVSVVLTSTYMLLVAAYAIDPLGIWPLIGDLVLPVVSLSYVASVFMKPLRDDGWYKGTFLTGHFSQFAIVCNLLAWVALMKTQAVATAIGCVVRLPLYALTFKLMLDLRNAVAGLPSPVELSDFLLGLLLRTSASVSTIVFFMFEVLSCWIENGFDEVCQNTSSAAMWLSIFLVIGTLMSIASCAAPKVVRDQVTVTKERIATFNLKKKEAIQLFMLIVVGVIALSLLSSLGVRSEPSGFNNNAGLVGVCCSGGILIIEATSLVRAHDVHLHRLSSGVQPNLSRIKSDRKLSTGTLADGMSLGGLV